MEEEKTIKKNNEKIDSNDNLEKELSKECRNKVKSLQKQIDEIEKPYGKKVDELNDERTKLLSEIRECERIIEERELKVKIKDSKKYGRFNLESFRAFVKLNKLVHEHLNFNNFTITEKKQMDNAVQIFKVADEFSWNEWFAFYGFKCIGFSYRRCGKHRGDSTTPYSYIGEIGKNKALRVKKKADTFNYEREGNATFTDWKKKLEKSNPEEIKEINLKNVKVLRKIKHHEGLNY